jgi:phenylpropionate dioxygenase-like ring-hydroxylating dioxygenase large terminal subunit
MTAFAFILLLAASTSVDLVDELYRIPASEWRYVEINLRQETALVSARYEVQGSSGKVRLALMTRADLEHFRHDLANGVLALTPVSRSGELNFRVRELSDYVLVVDNRADPAHEATVHLHVALDFGQSAEPVLTRISPQRQLVVIVLSFAFFFGVVTFSARKLLRLARK